MKNVKTTFLVAAAVALAFTGCKSDPGDTPEKDAVTFSGTIKGAVQTKANNAEWDAGDAVGIYMISAGGTLADNALAENKKYVTSGNSKFSPASAADQLYYPANGAAVDFISYYPYTEVITDYTYPVDVTDQSVQAAIDFLYSDNAKAQTKAEPTANMVFEHRLSKIILNITNKTEVSLAGLTVTVTGMNTQGTFSLADGSLTVDGGSQADFDMLVAVDGATAVAEAIVLPGGTFDYVLSFTIPADQTTKTLTVTGAGFESGKKYIYEVDITDKVALNGKGTIVDWNDVPSGGLEVDKNAKPKNVPFVYRVENTGAGTPRPVLPGVDELPDVYGLPDPFAWSDGSGRVIRFEEWKHRRAEILAEIAHYELSEKPVRPSSGIAATYDGTNIVVTVVDNGQVITITSKVNMPESGEGPFPVMLGANSTPAAGTFGDCIRIPFNVRDVSAYSMFGTPDFSTHPFYKMYPELIGGGQYTAWSWGISRLIDGLELVADQIGADLEHMGIIGCSYAGKMALFGGAFDERIALTLVQESGGGGINSWRVSDQVVLDNIANGDTDTEVERINNTSYSWFSQKLKDNFMGQPHKLPYDHHELIALIAPRAVLIYGNPDYVWMADKSGYTSTMAAYEVWKAMGIEDRFGFDFSDSHGHCSMSATQAEATKLFVDKFLLGIDGDTESIRKAPAAKYLYGASVDYYSWIDTWEGHSLR